MKHQEHEMFLKLLPELDRLIESIAWRAGLPEKEHEDLRQDVRERIWKKRAQAIQNDSIHFGYVEKCIRNVIANHKRAYLKHTNYLKYRSHRNSKPSRQQPGQKQSSLPDSDDLYLHYGGETVDFDVLDGNMDVLPCNQTPLDELLFHSVKAFHKSKKTGTLDEVILGLCLSGRTAGGTQQAQDIARQIGRNLKSVADALCKVRKEVKGILEWKPMIRRPRPKEILKA